MLSKNKVVQAEDIFCYRDYMCQVSKLQRMYVIGLILLSVLKTAKHARLGYILPHTTAPGCKG